jgi:excisionase family DNA binding protein
MRKHGISDLCAHPDAYITVPAFAEHLNVSDKTMRKWIKAGVLTAYQFQGGMANQGSRRRRFRRTGPFSGVAALAGTTSLRMTGHSASHAAQHHSRTTVGPLSVCCKLTLPTCPHLGQTGGTNKEKVVGRI